MPIQHSPPARQSWRLERSQPLHCTTPPGLWFVRRVRRCIPQRWGCGRGRAAKMRLICLRLP